MLDRMVSRSSRRFFAGGWGPRSALEGYLELLASPPPPSTLRVDWGPTYRAEGRWNRDGTFVTPHELLPRDARLGRLRLQWRELLGDRLCLVFAATSEHGYRGRSRISRRLTDAGLVVAMVENPFYGARRVAGGGPHTVYESLLMGRASVEEGIGLASALSEDFIIGVTGYSMGGSIAALVSAAAPIPVATAAIGASHSPGPVFTEGILSEYVDWPALGGIQAKDDLAAALGAASTLRVPAPAHTTQAILGLARDDVYIPPHSVIDLHRHWPGSELRWLKGGHASAHFRSRLQARLVIDSFARLTRPTVSPPA